MTHTGTSLPGGLGSLLSLGVESPYGTAAALTLSLPIISESLTPAATIIRSQAFRQGRYGPPSEGRAAYSKGGGGSFQIEATTNALGKLLRWINGGSPSNTQQGGGAAYLQTHTTGRMNTAGTSLTLQKGVGRDDGTVEPMTMAGCKCTGWEFACAPDQTATLNFDVDAQIAGHATTDLAAAAYPASNAPFHWDQMVVKRAGTALPGVSSVSLKGDNQLGVDRYRADGSGLKREPVEAAPRTVELSLDVEFGTLAATWDDLISDATQAWIVELVGANIATSYYQTLRFTIAVGKLLDSGSAFPQVSGDTAPLSQKIVIEALDDGTNPLLQTEYITSDTAY